MSVISFKEIHDGRDGEFESSRKGTVRRYTKIWRAVTDDVYDDAVVVKAAAPAMGSIHNRDPGAFLRRLNARNESFSKFVWLVTGAYSSEQEQNENPLADPADIEWNTDQFSRPYFADRDGYGNVNSAGDPYDPPVEGDDSRWTAVITKNVAGVPSWVLTYKDALNSGGVYIDGLYVAAGCAKMQSIKISKWQQRNDIWFRVLTFSVAVDGDGWAKRPLDAGFRKIDGSNRVKITDDDGKPVKSPALLDGSGDVLADPSPSNAVFRTHNIYKSRDFSVLPLS